MGALGEFVSGKAKILEDAVALRLDLFTRGVAGGGHAANVDPSTDSSRQNGRMGGRVGDEDDWLDSLDPADLDLRDAVHFRRIIAARKAIEDAEAELRAAVAAARQAGDSWTIVGAALNLTARSAYDRFGQPDEERPRPPSVTFQEAVDRPDEIADRFENGA